MGTTRLMVSLVGLVTLVTGMKATEPITLNGHSKAVRTLMWSADGKQLASSGDDRVIQFWDPITGEKGKTLNGIAAEGYGGPVVAFTADLKVAAINYWGEITIRSIPDGQTRFTIDPILDRGQKSSFRPDVFAMLISPDGRWLASAGSTARTGGSHGLPGGVVIIWDMQTGKKVYRFEGISTAPGSITWSADSKYVAIGTNGAGGELPEAGGIIVWDAESTRMVHNFSVKNEVKPGEWASAGDIAFSPDRRKMAAAVTAGSAGAPAGLIIEDTGAMIRVWDLTTSKSNTLVKGLKSSIGSILYSPDGKSIATAGVDGMVQIWDATTGAETASLKFPERATSIAYRPVGKAIAIGGKEGTIKIWTLPAKK